MWSILLGQTVFSALKLHLFPRVARIVEGSDAMKLSSSNLVARKESQWPKVTKQLRSLVGRAVDEFGMIREGDRVLVGLSGGKDSLTMLFTLLALQRRSPVKFEVAAATVDPMTPEYDPSPLKPYLQSLEIRHFMLRKPLIEMAKTLMDPKRPSICAFCSRMKRGMLYSCMRENGFNVLALGQHLDDLAESFLMSVMQNGTLRTMKANYWVEQGDIRVCRPLLYVRESMTNELAKSQALPIINDNCPACFAAPKERHRIKLLLSTLELDCGMKLFPNVRHAMRPLLAVANANRSEDGWASKKKEKGQQGLTKKQQLRQQVAASESTGFTELQHQFQEEANVGSQELQKGKFQQIGLILCKSQVSVLAAFIAGTATGALLMSVFQGKRQLH